MDNLPKDPAMLLSFVNLKLRDYYHSFDELCDDLQVDADDIRTVLKSIDYEYNEVTNRFE